jgi:hypothetical protein
MNFYTFCMLHYSEYLPYVFMVCTIKNQTHNTVQLGWRMKKQK